MHAVARCGRIRSAGGESTRSRVWADAQRLLEQRLQERQAAVRQAADAPHVTFDTLAAGYLEEYAVRELRTLNTARGRIAHLSRVFGGMQVAMITATQIRRYQVSASKARPPAR